MDIDILMVRPTYFDVTYSINPWMNTGVSVDKHLAMKQWEYLVNELIDAGLKISYLEGVPKLNDMVFAANAGMIYKDKAIVSKFRDQERSGEEQYFQNWFKENRYETHSLSDTAIWEGQACSVIIDDHLVCSYSNGGRANLEAYDEITKIWGFHEQNTKFVKLIDPYFYHLDVCFCKISENTSMLCPLAFSRSDNQWFEEHIQNIIPISYDEALSFGCNAFVHKNHIFLSDAISSELHESLEESGLLVHLIPMSEFIKSGGGVKCCILDTKIA